MNIKIKQLKAELKQLANQIKTDKREYRSSQSSYSKGNTDSSISNKIWKLGSSVDQARYEFRHKHIAYCLLRGRTIEQIESVCYTDRNMDYIKRIMKEHTDEVVCDNKSGPIEESTGSSSGTCISGDTASQGQESELGQRDSSISESKGSSFLGRLKEIFG